MPIPIEMSVGDITHHQDQSMTLQSLRTTNATVSNVERLKDEAAALDVSLDIVIFLCLCLSAGCYFVLVVFVLSGGSSSRYLRP